MAFMALAYVGTASRYGLESFLPEDPDTLAAIATRTCRGRNVRVGFFAMVTEEVAARVSSKLRAGERAKALYILEADASHIAPLCPWPHTL